MRISDWSSDVCSSDLRRPHLMETLTSAILLAEEQTLSTQSGIWTESLPDALLGRVGRSCGSEVSLKQSIADLEHFPEVAPHLLESQTRQDAGAAKRSEEHTSELQSLMRISYAVFCFEKHKKN